jgi:hypothetical protein
MRGSDIAFCLMLGCLFTHELDAVTQSEWRLIYVLRSMSDTHARDAFVALHVFLFTVILWFAFHSNRLIRERTRYGLAAFSIVHAVLHFRLRNDPLSSFDSPLSIALIGAAALLGVLYLLICKRRSQATTPD